MVWLEFLARRRLAVGAALLLAGCASTPRESLQNISYPRGLTQIVAPRDLQVKDRQVVSFVFKPDESLGGWSEMAGEAILPALADMDAKMAWLPMTPAFKACPSQTKSIRVVAVSARRANYEMQLKGCPGQPDYIQLGTIIQGQASSWHVFYGAKARELAPDKRADVERRFDAIRYVP